jgi:hypothetical protein
MQGMDVLTGHPKLFCHRTLGRFCLRTLGRLERVKYGSGPLTNSVESSGLCFRSPIFPLLTLMVSTAFRAVVGMHYVLTGRTDPSLANGSGNHA